LTLDDSHHTIIAGNGATISLPAANAVEGREYILIGGTSGATIEAAAGDNINGSASLSLDEGESVMVKSFATDLWEIVSDSRVSAIGINDLTDGRTINTSVFLGNASGFGASGDRNLALGSGSGLNVDGTDNVILGEAAGATLNTGNANIIIGQNAATGVGSGITSGSNNIMIGQSVTASAQTADNELNIGNALYATGLYGASAQVGVGNGNNAPNSTLSVGGSLSLPIRSGADTTLTDGDYTYIWIGASGTVTLPQASGRTGRIYIIKNATTSGTLTLSTTTGDFIDGSPSESIASGISVIVQSNGVSEWWIISAN
jgi:hypothetical protein